jgi:Cupin-like domain
MDYHRRVIDDNDAVHVALESKEECLPSAGHKKPTEVAVLSSENDTKLLDPESFYNDYVHHRRPCHIFNQCAKILSNSNVWKSFLSLVEKLIQKQEDDLPELEVNVRSNISRTNGTLHSSTTSVASSSKTGTAPAEAFITTEKSREYSFSPFHGSEIAQMSLKDLYQKIILERDHRYYLTTPTLSTDEEGRPQVMTGFTQQLFQIDPHFLPIRPDLFGHLIPMNIANIWLGATSTKGTSSGLHHDYHDNLYCLIRGTKVIRLASPQSIHAMKMVGTLHTLHPNGRIVYHEQISEDDVDDTACPIRPDGALQTVEQIVQLEIRKEEIELALQNSSIRDATQMEQLEEELNDIEEQLLDIEVSQTTTGNDGLDDDDGDDDEESEDESTGVFFGVAANDRKKHGVSSIPPPAKRRRPTPPEDGAKADVVVVPPNFVKEWDPSRVSFQTVTLQAGDALYIPAGWFHEVESMGSSDDDSLHMAINYWYHPPDAVTGVTNFVQPYRSQFWPRDWEARNL